MLWFCTDAADTDATDAAVDAEASVDEDASYTVDIADYAGNVGDAVANEEDDDTNLPCTFRSWWWWLAYSPDCDWGNDATA